MKKILKIGGSPCAGKSTLSDYLKNQLNYQVIHVDDFMDEHIKKAEPKNHPIMYLWKTKPWHDLFSRPVSIQVKEEIQFYKEEWPMMKADILKAIKSKQVIIEGCALMPSLIHDLLPKGEILYMVPEASFQRKKYPLRTWAFDLVKDATDPEMAFNRWMERDIAFAEHVKKEADKKGYPVIVMNGKESTESIAKRVIQQFKL